MRNPLIRDIALLLVAALVAIVLMLVAMAAAFAQPVAGPPVCDSWVDPKVAQPPYWRHSVPRSDGLGSYWYCGDGLRWYGYYEVLPFAEVPGVLAREGAATLEELLSREAVTLLAAPDKRAAANVLRTKYRATHYTCDAMVANAGVYAALCRATRDAMRSPKIFPPAPAAVVGPATSFTGTNAGTRPAYAWNAATQTRATTSNGRAKASDVCDCGVGAFGTSYCGANGKTDQVALCVRQ